MINSYLNPKAQDASDYIEDKLNDPIATVRPGFYLIKRPVHVSEPIFKSLYGVHIYTLENHDALRFSNERYQVAGLTVNTSLVPDPTPDVALIRILYKKTLVLHTVMKDISLVGDIFNRWPNGRIKTLRQGGHTGLLTDGVSHSQELAKSNNPGSLHGNYYDIFCKHLDTGIKLPRDKGIHISKNTIRFRGNVVKQLMDVGGANNTIDWSYNSSHVLSEDEKDRDLVSIRERFNKITWNATDSSKWKRIKHRQGIPNYAHRYMMTFYTEPKYQYVESIFQNGDIIYTDTQQK